MGYDRGSARAEARWAASAAAEPDLLLPPEPLAVARAAPRPVQIFAPLALKAAKARIQPLLTPDNYGDFIIPLVKSAQKNLYLQASTSTTVPTEVCSTNWWTPWSSALTRHKRQIILRDGDTRKMLEALKNKGFDRTR